MGLGTFGAGILRVRSDKEGVRFMAVWESMEKIFLMTPERRSASSGTRRLEALQIQRVILFLSTLHVP